MIAPAAAAALVAVMWIAWIRFERRPEFDLRARRALLAVFLASAGAATLIWVEWIVRDARLFARESRLSFDELAPWLPTLVGMVAFWAYAIVSGITRR